MFGLRSSSSRPLQSKLDASYEALIAQQDYVIKQQNEIISLQKQQLGFACSTIRAMGSMIERTLEVSEVPDDVRRIVENALLTMATVDIEGKWVDHS